MSKAYSMDLRVRAVETEGFSRRQAAARFGVSYSAAIDWLKRYHEKGHVAPSQIGGYRLKKIVGAHRERRLQRYQDADFTLRRLVRELAERVLAIDHHSVWASCTPRSSVKKNADRGRAGSRRWAQWKARQGHVDPSRLVSSTRPSGQARGQALDQNQHDGAEELSKTRPAHQDKGASRPLENHDLRGGAAP